MLPLGLPGDSSYVLYKLESEFVAVNSLHETIIMPPFQYACNNRKGLTVCNSKLLRINHTPTTCVESLLLNSSSIAEQCILNSYMVKPKKQDFIYIQNLKSVNLFSPYEDNIRLSCDNFSTEKA